MVAKVLAVDVRLGSGAGEGTGWMGCLEGDVGGELTGDAVMGRVVRFIGVELLSF